MSGGGEAGGGEMGIWMLWGNTVCCGERVQVGQHKTRKLVFSVPVHVLLTLIA